MERDKRSGASWRAESHRGSAAGRRSLLYGALALLYFLHNDLWLWDDRGLLAGLLPVGLAYHLAYCFAVALLFALLVRFAWPRALADEAVVARHEAEPTAPAASPGGER